RFGDSWLCRLSCRSSLHVPCRGENTRSKCPFKFDHNKFGPVDLAIMENGQYDQDWKYIHMMPDETAQAADDLRARAVLPGHAGRFVLAKHSWDEPYQRLAAASEGRAWRLLTPVQGEPVWVADKTQSFNAWWR
ncbi:MBL fold metallo-hydrolase, partial [Klebsiella pneumoniae]|nr:MBL fold metallo-hydrolase [Klebsiella pneumoniae]